MRPPPRPAGDTRGARKRRPTRAACRAPAPPRPLSTSRLDVPKRQAAGVARAARSARPRTASRRRLALDLGHRRRQHENVRAIVNRSAALHAAAHVGRAARRSARQARFAQSPASLRSGFSHAAPAQPRLRASPGIAHCRLRRAERKRNVLGQAECTQRARTRRGAHRAPGDGHRARERRRQPPRSARSRRGARLPRSSRPRARGRDDGTARVTDSVPSAAVATCTERTQQSTRSRRPRLSAPSSAAMRAGRRRTAERAGAPLPPRTTPPSIRPPASSAISVAARSSARSTPLGSTPRSKRYDESEIRP